MQNQTYEKVYTELKALVDEIHEENKRRIRRGFWCYPIFTVLFMLVVSFTDGSKNIFLLLWIIAIFLISAFLIVVEYIDHKIHEKFAGITETEMEEDNLIELPDISKQIEVKKEEQIRQIEELKEKLANQFAGRKGTTEENEEHLEDI